MLYAPSGSNRNKPTNPPAIFKEHSLVTIPAAAKRELINTH
jgi:hypothetical protein